MEDLNPREMVLNPHSTRGVPRIREDESPHYEKSQDVYETAGMYLSGPVLDAPRIYGAFTGLTIVPSLSFLTSIPDIAIFPVFSERARR